MDPTLAPIFYNERSGLERGVDRHEVGEDHVDSRLACTVRRGLAAGDGDCVPQHVAGHEEAAVDVADLLDDGKLTRQQQAVDIGSRVVARIGIGQAGGIGNGDRVCKVAKGTGADSAVTVNVAVPPFRRLTRLLMLLLPEAEPVDPAL